MDGLLVNVDKDIGPVCVTPVGERFESGFDKFFGDGIANVDGKSVSVMDGAVDGDLVVVVGTGIEIGYVFGCDTLFGKKIGDDIGFVTGCDASVCVGIGIGAIFGFACGEVFVPGIGSDGSLANIRNGGKDDGGDTIGFAIPDRSGGKVIGRTGDDRGGNVAGRTG
jgi:hypothetical protein